MGSPEHECVVSHHDHCDQCDHIHGHLGHCDGILILSRALKNFGAQMFMCLHQLCFVASQKFAFFPTNGLETLKGPVVPHLKFRSSDPRATGRTTRESVRLTEQTSATSPNHHLTTSKVPIVGRSQQLVSWLVGWFKVSLRPDSECASVCVSV